MSVMELLSMLLVVLGALLVRAGLRRRRSGERSGTRLLVLGAVLSVGVLGVLVSGTSTRQLTVASKQPALGGRGGHVTDREGQRYIARVLWDFFMLREGDSFRCVITELPLSDTPRLLYCSETVASS